MATEKETLDALRAQHGEVFETTIGRHDFVFRRATEIEYFKCIGASAKDQSQAPRALYTLAHSCVVHPSMDAFSAIVTKAPGVGVKLGTEILKIAQGDDEDLAGKA